MGLDVRFKVQLMTFELRNVSETDGLKGLNMPRCIFNQDDQEKAWVETWTSMDLLSLGKGSGIRDFLQETLGSVTFSEDVWADGVVNIPSGKVLYTLAQLYVDCLNKAKRTECYPWLDCHGNLPKVKEWLESFIICPDECFQWKDGGYRIALKPEILYRVKFRNDTWQEALNSCRLRFQWKVT